MASIEGTVYRISDVRAIEVDERSLKELFKLFADIRNDLAGSSADPRIHGVFVGEHELAKLYAEIMGQVAFGTHADPVLRDAGRSAGLHPLHDSRSLGDLTTAASIAAQLELLREINR